MLWNILIMVSFEVSILALCISHYRPLPGFLPFTLSSLHYVWTQRLGGAVDHTDQYCPPC